MSNVIDIRTRKAPVAQPSLPDDEDPIPFIASLSASERKALLEALEVEI